MFVHYLFQLIHYFFQIFQETDLEKMEKAEILEKTLEVLTRLRHGHKSQSSNSFSARKALAVRYASGFSSCMEESIQYIQNSHLVPAEVKVQLQNHLRAIAKRMEKVVYEDTVSSHISPDFSIELCSEVSFTELTPTDSIKEDTCALNAEKEDTSFLSTNEEPCQITSSRASPIHSTSSCSQQLIPHVTPVSPSYKQRSDLMNNKTGENLIVDQNFQKNDKLLNEMSNPYKQVKLTVVETSPAVHQPEVYPFGFTNDRQQITSILTTEPSYCLAAASVNEHRISNDSTIVLYSSPILSTTPLFSNQPVNYHVHEQNPTISGILVRPIHHMKTPDVKSHHLISNISIQQGALTSVLDLCVKRSGNSQISSESMWRPW